MYIIFANPQRDLVTALREKYFNKAEVNSNDFEGWKPDNVHEVHTKIWVSVVIKCLSPILVIGIYQIVNQMTNTGDFTPTKLNDIFDFPVVRSNSLLTIVII